MGRIKDLVIELQNEYGLDLENLPEGFSMEEYLKIKSEEMSRRKELFCEQVKSK